MSYGQDDVYYNPEKFGLTQIAQADEDDMSWKFNMFVVWKHTDGRVFAASDSGCSCPSPFEDYHNLNDLTLVDSYSQLKAMVNEWVGEKDDYGYDRRYKPMKDLLEKVKPLWGG